MGRPCGHNMGVSLSDFDECQPDAVAVGATSDASKTLARARQSTRVSQDNAPTHTSALGKGDAGAADPGLLGALRKAEER